MNCSTPGFCVFNPVLQLAQTHLYWVCDAISSSVIHFSSCFQTSPASGSFLMNRLFTSGGQSTGYSPSSWVLLMNTQGWSPLGWTGWISLQSKGLSSLFQHHSSKASILQHSAFFIAQLSHPYMNNGKTIALTRRTFVGKYVQAGFRKVSGTRDQIANICWIIEKAREFQKNIYTCFIDYAKAFDCVDHNKLWEILQEMGIPDHLTCLLRNLYSRSGSNS